MQGTPPWSLKLQVAGPAGAKIIEESDLTESRSRLSVPIPEEVDAEGGMFQIDLGAYETVARGSECVDSYYDVNSQRCGREPM